MFQKILKNRPFLSFFSAFIIFISIYLLSTTGIFSGVNERINNSFINVKNSLLNKVINEDIVVIKIDEKTLSKLGRFPFDRKYYAEIIENLNKLNASVIGLDIILADENRENPESDRILSEAMKKAGNVVLGGAVIVEDINNKANLIIEKPLKIFADNMASFGYYIPELSRNNTVLTFKPTRQISDKDLSISDYSHFGVSILKTHYSKIYQKNFLENYGSDKNFFYLRKNEQIPFVQTGSDEVFINFIPITTDTQKLSYFSNYSFIDVLENKIDPKKFDNKIILIGATAKGLKDDFQTVNGKEYGVFVHANIINTISTKNFLYFFPVYLEWILIFLVIITSIYFSLSSSGRIVFFSNLAIFIIFIIFLPVLSITFLSSYIYSHLFELFLSLPFSIAVGNATKFIFESNNRYKLSKALSEYVSKAIVKDILNSNGNIKLDGELKKLTIFFSDIEGFTSISEKFSPQELVLFLREYLSHMSNIILDENGFINKYEGDAIMALWGTFSEHKKDSYNACFSAVSQQKKLKELNKVWNERGLPEIKARIGLHTGEAIVGNIGAIGRKIEYTALGDSVNLASRLEGINKFYGTFICASENVYEDNKELFDFRYLDKIRVKGKEEPIKIYELISLKGELTENKKDLILKFNEAIKLYNNKDFINAKKIFEENFDKYKDFPSKTYIDRCEFYINNPLKVEEELIWKYETK